jgi:hypothetical protein
VLEFDDGGGRGVVCCCDSVPQRLWERGAVHSALCPSARGKKTTTLALPIHFHTNDHVERQGQDDGLELELELKIGDWDCVGFEFDLRSLVGAGTSGRSGSGRGGRRRGRGRGRRASEERHKDIHQMLDTRHSMFVWSVYMRIPHLQGIEDENRVRTLGSLCLWWSGERSARGRVGEIGNGGRKACAGKVKTGASVFVILGPCIDAATPHLEQETRTGLRNWVVERGGGLRVTAWSIRIRLGSLIVSVVLHAYVGRTLDGNYNATPKGMINESS